MYFFFFSFLIFDFDLSRTMQKISNLHFLTTEIETLVNFKSMININQVSNNATRVFQSNNKVTQD